jgi:flagellar motor switch protein FliG
MLMPAFAAVTDNSGGKTAEISLLEQESKYEKDKSDYLQQNVVDKILGPGNAVVIVDVELGIETKVTNQGAKEKKTERKKRLGEVEYLLPGVPNPKSVANESQPGESKEETGAAEETKTESKTVIKKLTVTVLYDEKIIQEKLDTVKEAIVNFLRIDSKRGDKIEFKKTKFTSGFFEEVTKPLILIPLVIAMLVLFFLFGPLASFFRNYVRTLAERGGTEVTVDSKFEGDKGDEEGAAGSGGGGGIGEGLLGEKDGKKYIPFEYINDDNLKRLVYLIKREPPETISLVVSYLKPEYVKELLNALEPELQAKVATEMATIRSLNMDDVKAVDNYIKEKIEFLIGGLYHLLNVLDKVDPLTQANIFEYLKNEKPDLYEMVRKFVLMFDDVPNFPDQAMQVIIRELKTQDMARALRNASPEIMNKFLANMSTNAAAILKEEMEYGRPLTDAEVEDSRKQLMDVVKKLEDESKIFLREKPKSGVLEGLEAGGGDNTSYAEYYNAGVEYYDAQDYNSALPYLEYCTQLDPTQPSGFQYLGATYYALGRTADAVAAYEKVIALDPANEELKNWLATQEANKLT